MNYIYIYTYIYIYICIHLSISLSLYLSIHIYIYIYVGSVVTFWLSRKIVCFTRDIHDFMMRSCSAAIVQPSNVVTKRRFRKANIL